MADTKTYLYSVNPRKTITGLSKVAPFRSPKSLFLTLDDVKACLEKATVYRRFANEGRVEKVTIGNVDRLHNDVFMTEKEFEEFKVSELGKNSATVKKEKSQPASEAPKVETKAEEPKIEESVPVDVKEEDASSKENVSSVESEEIYESDEDEEVEKVDSAEEE